MTAASRVVGRDHPSRPESRACWTLVSCCSAWSRRTRGDPPRRRARSTGSGSPWSGVRRNRAALRRVGAGLTAAWIDARPGLAIGVGGRPMCMYVLYGVSSRLTSVERQARGLPVNSVASICSGMPIWQRLRMTRAIIGRSSSIFASRSIIDATISTWYGVRPSALALLDDLLLADDALHQLDHPLDDCASETRRREPDTCRGTAGPPARWRPRAGAASGSIRR